MTGRAGRTAGRVRVDRLGGRMDEYLFREIVEFSRVRAWETAENAQIVDHPAYDLLVGELDDDVSQLGSMILRPAPLTRTLMRLTRLRERGNVGNVIDSLVTHMQVV